MKRNEDPFIDLPEWVDREKFSQAVEDLAEKLGRKRNDGDIYSVMIGMGIVPITGPVMMNGMQWRWELNLSCRIGR